MRKWLLLAVILTDVAAKIHHLVLMGDTRRNIILSSFGYGTDGTFDLILSNFSVPDKISKNVDSSENSDKMGVIGFSLSRGISIAAGVGSNPHVCQLQQTDQGFDALFFIADVPNNRLRVYRSGMAKDLKICPSHESCEASTEGIDLTKSIKSTTTPPPADEKTVEKISQPNVAPREKRDTILEMIKKGAQNLFGGKDSGTAYVDYVPFVRNDNLYSTNISIRFPEELRGKYHFIYHNCFNYKAYGYSDRVAVDFTVDMIEMNAGSYLSAGDVPKPQLLLYVSLLFLLAGFLWTHMLCLSERSNVYRVHGLMTALIFLKTASLFFHGVNFYFVSNFSVGLLNFTTAFWISLMFHDRRLGRNQDTAISARFGLWYTTSHICVQLVFSLKGALLFGTMILIGTGYTFFRNFLTERDRKVFMVVLPLQIVDNIAMVILEESESGQLGYQFWYEMFIFLDMICCLFVFFPIIWSMQHLQEGARSDGKAAFNLQKLRLFRQFYILVICYIYLTRIIKVLLQYALPFDLEWLSEAVVEVSTLVFFVLVGMKFRPRRSNPYLKLELEDDDDDTGVAITRNGLLEGVVNRGTTAIQMDDIPGGIGGVSDSDEDDDLNVTLKSGLERTLL